MVIKVGHFCGLIIKTIIFHQVTEKITCGKVIVNACLTAYKSHEKGDYEQSALLSTANRGTFRAVFHIKRLVNND